MPEVNYLAVVAAGATFLFGGFWYSRALFGAAWGRAAGLPQENEVPPGEKRHRHPATVFGVSFLFSVLGAYALAVLLGPKPEVGRAVAWGATAGAAFVAGSFGTNYAFAGRSTVLWLIDGGYHTVQFALMGLVLGLWH